MFKITNTRQLGTIYTITDSNNDALGTMQVIYASDILESALGEYDDTYTSYTEYLTKSIEYFSGQDSTQLHKTLCWTKSKSPLGIDDDELHLTQAFEYAITHGYTTIIFEDIPNEE